MTNEMPEPWRTAATRVGLNSYRKLAAAAGLSHGTIQRAFTGQRKSVAPATIVGLSRALRLPEETISEYLGMGQQTIQEYTPPEEASMLTRRERDAIDEIIRLLVASRAKPANNGNTEQKQNNKGHYRSTSAGRYVSAAMIKREQYEQNPDAWNLAAKERNNHDS